MTTDLCHAQKITFVLGHALYMRAIYGAKTKDDKIDSQEQDMQMLGQCILGGYTSSGHLLELCTQPPRFTLEVTARPVASPLARLQARSANNVTNLRHETVMLDEVGRMLLKHLDGSRDRAGLRDILMDLVKSGDQPWKKPRARPNPITQQAS